MSEENPEMAQTYESATARLDEIIQRLDSGEAQLRETLDLCEEAKGLIEYCAGELAAVDQGLKELKLEDLATSLTGSAPAPPAATGPRPAEDPGFSPEPASETAAALPEEAPPPPDDVPF